MSRARRVVAANAGLLTAAWLVSQLVEHIRKRKAEGKPFVFVDPDDYEPSNPRWLVPALSWKPAALTSIIIKCPAWQTFQGSVGDGQLQQLEFGAGAREALFQLDPDVTYLNHGSYGAALRLALDVQIWYRQQLELQPVEFVETVALKEVVKAVADVANFIGADYHDVVPVINATTAVNSVLNSLQLSPGDAILLTSSTYPAVRSAAARAAKKARARLLDLQLTSAQLADEEAVVAAYAAGLRAGGRRIKLAIVDHIVSFPPVVLPVQRICALCREWGVPVLVDGAHAGDGSGRAGHHTKVSTTMVQQHRGGVP